MMHPDLFTSAPSDTVQQDFPPVADAVSEVALPHVRDLEPSQTLCARLGAAMTNELMRPTHAGIEVLKDVDDGRPFQSADGGHQTAMQLRKGPWGLVLEVSVHDEAPRIRIVVDPVLAPRRVSVKALGHDGLAQLEDLVVTARALVNVVVRVADHPGAWRWEDVRV